MLQCIFVSKGFKKSTIMCVAFCHLIEQLHYKCQERLRVAFRQPSCRRRWCILKSTKRLGVNQGIQEILALLSEETTREIYAHKLAQNYKANVHCQVLKVPYAYSLLAIFCLHRAQAVQPGLAKLSMNRTVYSYVSYGT